MQSFGVNKSTPYVPSPLLVEGLLYFVSENKGMLSCFDAKTGKAHFEAERLEGIFGIYASPVSAKDRVYVLGREGVCLVLKKGPKLEILGTNKLADKTDASLAIVGKEIFLRGHQMFIASRRRICHEKAVVFFIGVCFFTSPADEATKLIRRSRSAHPGVSR